MKKDSLDKELGLKNQEEQSFLERVFEKALWSTRYTVLFAVVFSILGSISLFVLGSYEIIHTLVDQLPQLIFSETAEKDHSTMLYKLIAGIDLYLIGVVLLIFGFGIYELFISKIDIAREDEAVTILEIENLGKQKLIEQASLSSMKLPTYKAGSVSMKGFRVFVKIDPNAKG